MMGRGVLRDVLCRALPALVMACACSLAPTAAQGIERHAVDQDALVEYDVRVLERGRFDCPLNPVADSRGAVSDDLAYIAVSVWCREGRRQVGYTEIVNTETGRSHRHDIDVGWLAFLPDGRLLGVTRGLLLREADCEAAVLILEWQPPYDSAPTQYSFCGPDGLHGAPAHVSLSPGDDKLLLLWSGFIPADEHGALELLDISDGVNRLRRFFRNDLSWLNEESRFSPLGGAWLNESVFVLESYGDYAAQIYSELDGDVLSHRTLFNIQTGQAVPDPTGGGLTSPLFRFSPPNDESPTGSVSVGRLMRILPSGDFLFTNGVDGTPSERRPWTRSFEVYVRSGADFSVLGGVEREVAVLSRQLNGYDVSADGRYFYAATRSGTLDVYSVSPWQLQASISTREFRLPTAWQVLVGQRSDQLVLMESNHWRVVRIRPDQ